MDVESCGTGKSETRSGSWQGLIEKQWAQIRDEVEGSEEMQLGGVGTSVAALAKGHQSSVTFAVTHSKSIIIPAIVIRDKAFVTTTLDILLAQKGTLSLAQSRPDPRALLICAP